MEKIVLYMLIFMLGLTACKQQGYLIEGRAEELEGEEVFLYATVDEKQVVLGHTVVKDGKFEFRGTVTEVTPSRLSIEGMYPGLLFLENSAVFKVSLKPGQLPLVESGSETQRLYEGLIDIDMDYGKEELNRLTARLVEASRKEDSVKVAEVRTAIKQVYAKKEEAKEAYRKEHGNTFFALYELNATVYRTDAVKAREFLDLCGEELKNTSFGRQVVAKIETLEGVCVGAVVPDFTAATPEGRPLSLYGTEGRVKFIDFWASTCAQCRREHKLLLPLYEKYRAQGFEIISISLDTQRDRWVAAIEKDGMPWPQVSDLKGTEPSSVAALYAVPALPYTVLVDADNRVIARDIHYDRLKDTLPELLKGN